MPIRPHFLIADDHDLFRSGLRYALIDGIEGIRITEAGSFVAASQRIAGDDSITLASFDLRMPGMEGGQALLGLRRQHPKLPIVVLSGFEDRRNVLAALELGASGFIPKSLPAPEIVSAMREVMTGRIFIPPSVTNVDTTHPTDIEPDAPHAATTPPSPQAVDPDLDLAALTARKRDVLDGLLGGRSTKQIARDLDLAEGTVKIHIASLFRILGARNRTEAVTKAITLGLASPPGGRGG